jgi:hypothetical protein
MTITIPQEEGEVLLIAQLERIKGTFYYSVPCTGLTVPLKFKATNWREAKQAATDLLYLTRATFRAAQGKSPDLPEHLKEIEAELPAYLQHLQTSDFGLSKQ